MTMKVLFIIKIVFFAFYSLLFWAINTDVFKIIFALLYIGVNVITFYSFFKDIVLINNISKIVFLIGDLLYLTYSFIFMIYYLKQIPMDGDEKFATIFFYFCLIGVILFFFFNVFNFFVLKRLKFFKY